MTYLFFSLMLLVLILTTVSLIYLWNSNVEKKVKCACCFTLIISVVSFFCSYFRSPFEIKDEIEFIGIIIAIIAIPVSILIGWNIFSIIDIKKIRDELLTTKVSSVFNAEKNNAITCHAVSDYYYHVLLKSDPLGIEYQFLYYRISELFHVSNIGDIDTCNVIVKVLLEMIKSPEDIHVLQSCKDRLIGLLSIVSEKEKITKYNELMSVIARLGTKPRDNK